MARPFIKLRAAFQELDLNHDVVAEELQLTPAGLSRRMNNKMEWRLEEIYAILDLIHQPYSMIHVYFPRRGINEPGVSRRRAARAFGAIG